MKFESIWHRHVRALSARVLALLLVALGSMSAVCSAQTATNSPATTGRAGNPVFPGWYADPEGAIFAHEYWIYPTYYGGWRHCNIARLRDDFKGFEPFPDGGVFKEITPEGYVEGPCMYLRNGKYYFMWSEGGWTGPNYSVAYAIADSPLGPFQRIGKILQQDPQVATGAGHHSLIKLPDGDTWFIVYHRRPLGDREGNHRVTCIDRLDFDAQGRINPVKLTFEGVARRPLN